MLDKIFMTTREAGRDNCGEETRDPVPSKTLSYLAGGVCVFLVLDIPAGPLSPLTRPSLMMMTRAEGDG